MIAPCPFCGSPNALVRGYRKLYSYYWAAVYCRTEGCGATGPVIRRSATKDEQKDVRHEAVLAWNKRGA